MNPQHPAPEKPPAPEASSPRPPVPDTGSGRGTKDDGRKAVLSALSEAHPAHRDTCPLRNPQEERAAA
ncbi:hypothetical protein SGFS_071450 [Streptomyces graminofaciens]|uniref:Uncharacterized protein n=1 Tax=Streptomyces graminofaciens TaxID=68212 RepID=A0ABM7FH04_9ACTN|nr:hypothetical protein SGFS_071450 [Streptomyces graminofaciens]